MSTNRYKLKKLDLGSVALYSFVMFFIISLLFMLPFSLFFMAMGNFFSNTMPENIPFNPFSLFSGIFLIFMPLLYAIFGTIINTVIALLYNLLSTRLGGIRFSVEKIAELETVKKPEEIVKTIET
ncbi:MAG: hypothetical protein GF350_11420 [Chitinivibrionales bacterium]|nr:hypothetical protein [Chitinivibrionales bacterium]